MQPNTSHLQPDSAGSAAPDLNDPEAQRAPYEKIRAAYLSGRAAQASGGR